MDEVALRKVLGLILIDKSPVDLQRMTGLPLDQCIEIMSDLISEIMTATIEEE